MHCEVSAEQPEHPVYHFIFFTVVTQWRHNGIQKQENNFEAWLENCSVGFELEMMLFKRIGKKLGRIAS